MENTVEIYQEEKELRGKRLAAYAESIQEKVQKDSEQIIKILVTEGFRADYKNTSRREIPPEEDPAGDGGYNRGKSIEHS